MTQSKEKEFEKELDVEISDMETDAAPEEVTDAEVDVAEEDEEESFEDEGAEEVVEEIKKIKKDDVSLENFNWDTYSNAPNAYAADERAQMEAMYDKTLSSITENEIIDGTVIAMNKREVVINIGYKSEGIVSMNEFRYNPDLKVGDTVEVYVESSEDKKGQLILSHKTARSMRSWDRVNQALENDEIITGYIKCRTKGGMIVDVFGIEAFLPGSQIDVKPIRDYDVFVGKTTEFKIVKINHDFKNVVVSHKALIEAELELQKAEIISKLEKGQVLEGIVKNITTYGVFIDLGGVDGLIHITDLSWGRVSHPEEVVQLDEKLNVVILDFDDSKKRIALGLKQLTPHPWDALDPDLKVGDIITGKVVVIADYGAFVEISTGVEGLIHVSEMSWSQHLRSAQDFLKVSDIVEAKVLTLDRDDRKMSLGIKQLKPDPWDTIDEKYSVGSQHAARVRNFTNFGVFVEIEEGVDGLIHISDLSWTKKVKHPSEFTQIGETINVMVLEIDRENRRLSLGHKQLEENPWDVFETIFTVDSIHEGTIVEIFDRGAIVTLPYGVEGFVTPKHMIKEDGTPAKLDEKLNFKVIEFNKSSKRIIVSHSRTFEDLRKEETPAKPRSASEETKLATKKLQANLEKTTLGDITGLAALKEEMEATEKKGSRKKAKAEPKKPKEETPAQPEAVEPVVEVAEPVVEPIEPVAEVVEPAVEVVEPVAEVTEPIVEVTEPIVEVAEPVAEVTEPVVEVTEPVAEVTEPVAEVAEPVAEVTEPVAEVTEPVVEVTEPIVEVTEPIVEVAEPAAEVIEPVTEVTEAEVTEPTAETSVEVEPVEIEIAEVSESKADESASDKE